MRIDIWTHLLSPAYIEHLEGRQSQARFLLAQRAMCDLPFRLKVIEGHEDYRQVLTPLPGTFIFDGTSDARTTTELVARNNDELAAITAQHPEHFAGFAAATPITDPDAATEEAVRAVTELGALGIQLEADAASLPLHEDRYDPLFEAMARLGAAVWLHPSRTQGPTAVTGTPSRVPWQVLGWPFDTTMTITHLILAGVYDRHPTLKLIAHHGGGLIPHFSGRLEMIPRTTGLDPSGGLANALERLEKDPIEYFRMPYVDTAILHGHQGVRCVVDFFGTDHVLFGTDAPFDGQGGAYFITQTSADIEGAFDSQPSRDAVFHTNANQILGIQV